jgi:hypothetical protein
MSPTPTIEHLLDQLHQALLSADFHALSLIAPQLEARLSELTAQTDRLALERLRRKADRNAACALASGRGVRAALRRMEDIRQAAAGLMTYDQKGQRSGRNGAERLSRRF